MEPLTESFGVRLRSLIENKGVSIEAFAKALGVAASTVHLWLNKETPPHQKYWKSISDFFGASQSYVVHGRPAPGEKLTAPIESPAVGLAASLQSDFASILELADNNRDRLGWLRVQLDQLSAVARTWLTPEEVNEEARRLAKKMGEEAARQRAEFEQTIADPSRLGAEMERLRQRALLEDDARRSRKTG